MYQRIEVSFTSIALLLAGCTFDTSGLAPDPQSEPNSYECACECSTATRGVLSMPSQSADDAEEVLMNGAVLIAGQFLDLGQAGGGELQVVGIRFPNVGIPQGATIVSADIQFTAHTPTTGPSDLQIFGEASDDAQPFPDVFFGVSSRPLTTAVVNWNPPDWDEGGVSGPAQTTPNLAAVFQDIVNRPGWVPGNAAAVHIYGTGRRLAFSYDANPLFVARLTIEYTEPAIGVSLPVCMPANLNPNFNSNPTPTLADLQADCSGRVEDTLSGLALACDYPSMCTCTVRPESSRYVSTCNAPCDDEELNPDCSNFDPPAGMATATNAAGDEAVCVATSPVAAFVYGKKSQCEVEGETVIEIDDESRQPDATGIVHIDGAPCPGASCLVGMSYRLDLDPITFGNLFGSATFEDLAALGRSFSGSEALLDVSGNGTFAPNATAISARGRRGSDSRGVSGSNNDVIHLEVDWEPGAAMCAVNGALIGTTDPEISRCESAGPNANEICDTDDDCTDDPACSGQVCNCLPIESAGITLAIDLQGPIVNQPPTANAGQDQVVECNQPNSASFLLDARASHDPDNNMASFVWFRSSRVGPIMGFQPSILVEQDLGTEFPYIFRVIDTMGQSDEDTTMVQVVDTTPPVISCNAQANIIPPDAPISFTATAEDVCDPDVTPEIVSFDCFMFNKAGKRVDKTKSCVVRLDGDTIIINDSGGVGDHIVWNVRAVDDSGNVGVATCQVVVVKPGSP